MSMNTAQGLHPDIVIRALSALHQWTTVVAGDHFMVKPLEFSGRCVEYAAWPSTAYIASEIGFFLPGLIHNSKN